MRHLGDITKLNGAEIPVVDVITGGSPCQDLSTAGKRAGLSGKRSGLFMEQIRVVKEMRERERNAGRSGWAIRPRYMVWENVPGALSSNHGEDFRIVLEEVARISQKDAIIPRPPRWGWSHSGAIVGDGWSIAWRIHDAQFWGVPQRRKRIALVADFGGLSAPEVLFERESLSGNPESCKKAREGIAEGTGRSTDQAISFQERAGKPGGGKGILIQTEHVGALSTVNNQNVLATTHGGSPAVWSIGSGQAHDLYLSEVARALNCMHETQAVYAYGIDVYNQAISGDTAASLTAASGGVNTSGPKVMTYGLDRASFNQGQNAKFGFTTLEETEPTLTARGPNAIGHSIIRRLTPTECERLQGFPDGWTDIGEWIDKNGKKRDSSDTARYKALGNSIALPFWQWLMNRISAQYDRPATLGSLFDGIGGFPYCWEKCNGKGTAIWASEIEEFPIAVTRLHFPEGDE